MGDEETSHVSKTAIRYRLPDDVGRKDIRKPFLGAFFSRVMCELSEQTSGEIVWVDDEGVHLVPMSESGHTH